MKRKDISILLVLLSIIIAGCNSENSRIKKALKTSISTEQVKNYKYKSHQILETLLRNNVLDSISLYESRNHMAEISIARKQQMKQIYKEKLDDCLRQQHNTLYWLRSSYNSIIRDWQRMLDEAQVGIDEDSLTIVTISKRIEFFRQHLKETKSPIVFYKVRHEYLLNGAYRSEDVILDSNYQLIK